MTTNRTCGTEHTACANSIETTNRQASQVSLASVLNSAEFQQSAYDLPVVIGNTANNDVFVFDLAQTPSLLMAGATGQGKTSALHTLIASLLCKKHPGELKLVLMDLDESGFSSYAPLAKAFMTRLSGQGEAAVITDVLEALQTLEALTELLDSRYETLEKAGARNVKEYNEMWLSGKLDAAQGFERMPYLVGVVDEFATLMLVAGKAAELPLARIAQLGRAVGMHMVVGTHHCMEQVVSENIAGTYLGRIVFRTAAAEDSRLIVGQPGAEQLNGHGDMLVVCSENAKPVRVQCANADATEIRRVVDFLSSQCV